MIEKSLKRVDRKNKQHSPNFLAQSSSGQTQSEMSNNKIDQKKPPVNQENVQTDSNVGTHTKTAQLVSEHADASEDNKDDTQLQVPLVSRNDAVYMGTVYLGSPESQPANVVFDTGSEYLAVTSSLCDDRTSGTFKFKKYDPGAEQFVARDQTQERCKTMAYDMHKSDSNKILSKASSKLTYGSAKLQGFIWEDYTCI